MALFKKKKAKASLEIPPPPSADDTPVKDERFDIPDKFHEVKSGGRIEVPPVEEDISSPIEKEIPPPEEFKPVSEVSRPDIPEMPELPDIPELPKEEVAPKMMEGPLFIKSRDYQEILGNINKIKESVAHTDDVFKRMNEIKNEKDKIFNEWKRSLEDIQRKLIYIEKSLFEV